MEENETEENEVETNDMAGKFQLYCGLVKDGEFYNYAALEKIKGGILTILDGADDSIPSRLMNIAKGCVKKLYTASGKKEIELTEKDYFNFTMIDAKLIARKYANYLTDDKHIFTEYFRCPRCSDGQKEVFADIFENWSDLIESGDMAEYFAENKDDLIFETILPNGIKIEGNKRIKGGKFNKVLRRHITIADSIDIKNDSWAMESDSNRLCAYWDKQIVSIDGMDDLTLKTYCKRSGVSLTKKYLIDQDDIDAMIEDSPIGLDTDNRIVRCKKCRLEIAEINGGIDESNFFSAFFQSKKSSQKSKRAF